MQSRFVAAKTEDALIMWLCGFHIPLVPNYGLLNHRVLLYRYSKESLTISAAGNPGAQRLLFLSHTYRQNCFSNMCSCYWGKICSCLCLKAFYYHIFTIYQYSEYHFSPVEIFILRRLATTNIQQHRRDPNSSTQYGNETINKHLLNMYYEFGIWIEGVGI